MHLVFKKIDEWFEKSPGLREVFQDTYQTILVSAQKYASKMNEMTQKKIGTTISIEISELLLKQSLIDAYDDLMRLTDYHPTKDPNPIKKMAYIVYWLLRHKPIRVQSEDVIASSELKDIARTRLLFINEEFGVKLLVNSAFNGKKKKEMCTHMFEEGDKQLNDYKQYLLYYLIYRVDSPKALEAMMLACTIHPIWEVDPIIWSSVKEAEL